MNHAQTNPFLNIQGVTKKYATKIAVHALNLKIPQGVIFGLLGPNGAGKTSLIRMITGITAPDEGKIEIEGRIFTEKDQQYIGYMPEERGLYKKMKIGEQLQYLLQLKGLSGKAASDACEYWLDRMEIAAWKNRKVEELSKGMQQKIQFIATIAHKPRLIILDEPFSGLDPLNSKLVEEIIHELKREGATILFSTHRMEQVEQLCDEIALINKGMVVLEGNVKEIRQRYRKSIYNIILETGERLPELEGMHLLSHEGELYQVQLSEGLDSRKFIGAINQACHIQKVELFLPSLSDIFIEVVSQKKAS
jgi:ABC-2 type transport system ATP-binding protein